MARIHRRYKHRRNRGGSEPSPRRNPPLFTDLAEWVGPGFAGFAVTRLVTRIASSQVAKAKPSLGKHAGAITSVGTFLAAWFLAHRWKVLAKYHMPITVGAALASIQSLVQLYIPKIGWIVADPTPEIATSALTPQQIAATQMEVVPVDDDPNEYVYNDAFDNGRYAGGKSPPFNPNGGAQIHDDMADLAVDDAIGQAGNLGVFSN